jgi:hypothetical protein
MRENFEIQMTNIRDISNISLSLKRIKKVFICSKSSNPLDLSQKNPRAKCQYFTETLAAS